MCIVFYTLSQPGYKLILLSNRDEYFDRPALPAQWHDFSQGPSSSSSASSTTHSGRPWVLSGLDKGSKVNGTWLGLTKDLRIGVITNIRLPIPGAPKPPSLDPNPPSRGLLLRDYLAPSPAAARPVKEYLNSHLSSAGSYDGFNLLLFRFPASSSKSGRGMMWGEAEVGYLANRPEATYTDLSTSAPPAPPAASASEDGLEEAVEAEVIEGHEAKEAGVHCVACGLSNTPLDRPWPKVINGQAAMEASLAEWSHDHEDEEALLKRMFAILSHGKQLTSLADAMSTTCLPPVRLGRDPMQPLQLEEGETGRWYGTRVSTVILVRDDGEVVFVERDMGELGPDGQARTGTGERRFKFTARE